MAIFGHSKFVPVFLRKIVGKKFKMAIFGHTKFIPVFLGKIVGKKIWNGHFWPYQIYTSPFGKHCQKKLEHPFLAIPNLYQSFWEKLSEKDWNNHFWPFLIYTSSFGKNCWKKFRMAIFGHSKFVPVFLTKIVGKNLKWPFLAIPNLYQSFWETLSKKNWNIHFWPFLIYTSLFGKNCWKKNSEWPFLAIPNLYQSFWEKLSEKIWNGHFLAMPNLYQSFLGKIARKKLEHPFLAIPNLYQSFWEKLSEKDWNKHFSPFLIYTSSFGKNCQKKIGTTIFGHS